VAPDLLQMLTPVATLVLGAVLTRIADERKDGRAAQREQHAAARQDARERRAFERATLIELQEAVMRLGGGTTMVWSAAEREFVRSHLWNVYLSGDGSEQQREGYLAVRRLGAARGLLPSGGEAHDGRRADGLVTAPERRVGADAAHAEPRS
jgi:hypothetical protein